MRPSTCWEPARWHEGGRKPPPRPGPGSRRVPVRDSRRSWAACRSRSKRGRFAEAEQIIKDALDDPRIDRSSLRILLGPVYCLQGRLEETLRLIESRWEASEPGGRRRLRSRPSIWFGHTSISDAKPSRSRSSAPSSIRPGRWHPMTIGSGWEKPTWRSAPARTTRPRGGSTPACGGVPRMARSGAPGWTGRWRRIASPRHGRL